MPDHSNPAGPVFIVGLSRSGTKLLRNILNGHPNICIPDRESYFIPYTLTHIGHRGVRPDSRSRARFIRHLRRSVFYRNMNEHAVALPLSTLKGLVENGDTWPGIIESIFRHYTGTQGSAVIWGDKTPKYLKHIQLLSDNFAGARFLHIYRDPRDRVLSANRAWGANIYIGAQQWLDTMQEASRQGAALGAAYKPISYESLISRPAEVVTDICDFLDLEFDPAMLNLEEPVERRGDMTHATRQHTEILATNQKNYLTGMTPRQLARVERIVFPYASELGYLPQHPVIRQRPLGRLEKLLFLLPHTIGNLRLPTRRWGIVGGIRHAWSSWRL